jgi:ribosomal protein L7/L12
VKGFELEPQTPEERDRRLAELEAAEEQTEFDVLLEDRAAEKQGAWFEQVNR